ncbi:MAG: signal recognition particle-docking protein FtsY [Acidimicrobiales bacterium]|jgi:fused signal recognition particle receptor|nr:signal recognition particle-docking protein FtsY [Acidimicrobiaceae bacterium]MDP6077199.1 signal recognition particle-docking protein FtsY [Acidimicrobiales bacterium]HJO79213.1 signal recognition particle-docking protein FtsY [Acidimicrobiales bacterium]|tara:strand:- start:2011 stop:2922 length:912 start_codon:yes stop_codon:yes gene_type:complete
MSVRSRLGKARNAFAEQLRAVRSVSTIDASTWNALEEALILSDLGVSTTADVIASVRQEAEARVVDEPDIVLDLVRAELVARLGSIDRSLSRDGDPAVWLFVGVNGVGKTTTVGKLGRMEVDTGTRVVLAAGDTYRAAAADQLVMWGDRVGAPVVRGAEGADPSSVVFDTIEHAAAVDAELVLVDTAGRVHTQGNLMDELSKVRRVAEKGVGTVTETLLVVDATTGQNGLVQARRFMEAADVTGVVLTKLDGSARGGIVIAVQEELGIPVKMVGVGEGPDDLVRFDPAEFVDALFKFETDMET